MGTIVSYKRFKGIVTLKSKLTSKRERENIVPLLVPLHMDNAYIAEIKNTSVTRSVQ